MSTVARSDARIKSIDMSDEMIIARLADGRIISVPLAWSWRLCAATPAQRANYEIIGDGHGVHWPDIDEDISAAGMLGLGQRPPIPEWGIDLSSGRNICCARGGVLRCRGFASC